MNKLTIPTILAATVMVAGIFAFMPVEQASTVHTTLATAADNTVLTTDIGDASGAAIGGSITAGIEAIETQIATMVTTGNAAELAATGTRSEITPIAATGAAGIAYVTVDVTAADATANADTIDVELNGVVICTIDAEVVATTTCVGAVGAAQSVTVQEVDGVGDNADAAFSAFAVVISTAPDTT